MTSKDDPAADQKSLPAGFEYNQHLSHKHAAMKRFRRRFLHALMLVIVIIVTTLLMNLVEQTVGQYRPNHLKEIAR